MRDQPKKQQKPTSSKCVREKMSKAVQDNIVQKKQTVLQTGPADTTITADIHRNLTQFVESCDQLDIPVNDINQQKCEGTGVK